MGDTVGSPPRRHGCPVLLAAGRSPAAQTLPLCFAPAKILMATCCVHPRWGHYLHDKTCEREISERGKSRLRAALIHACGDERCAPLPGDSAGPDRPRPAPRHDRGLPTARPPPAPHGQAGPRSPARYGAGAAHPGPRSPSRAGGEGVRRASAETGAAVPLRPSRCWASASSAAAPARLSPAPSGGGGSLTPVPSVPLVRAWWCPGRCPRPSARRS